jgi:hypothetical protein
MGRTVTVCGMLKHTIQKQFTIFLRYGEEHKPPPELKDMLNVVLTPQTLCLWNDIRLNAPTIEISGMLFHIRTIQFHQIVPIGKVLFTGLF